MQDYTKYFKSKKGFDRFIKLLYKKYQSLGRFSGKVKLECLTSDEADCLTKFWGTTYKENETINLSISKLLNIMEYSKFENFDINTLVEEYLGVTLITKKELKDNFKYEEERFFKSLIEEKNTRGNNWLRSILSSKDNPYRILQQRYRSNKDSLRLELINIINLIDNLPSEQISLPVFSSIYTTDPHYLDLDESHNTLFMYVLSFVDNSDFPISREDKIKLLSKYNITIDYLSNYVITYNILSNRNCINEFASNREPLNLNIQNILATKKFDTKSKCVFIFENPSILSEIQSNNLDIPVIISYGFTNLSVYLLLDKLQESNNLFYYNGDFDPEGLLIAEKLKNRYKDNLKLFCYNLDDYENCKSNKKISASSLKKLNKLQIPELKPIKIQIENSHFAGYQENNKENIIKNINNILKEK